MHPYRSPEIPQTPKSHDALIEVSKLIKNKLHFCTYFSEITTLDSGINVAPRIDIAKTLTVALKIGTPHTIK